jgi:hypothetical protein
LTIVLIYKLHAAVHLKQGTEKSQIDYIVGVWEYIFGLNLFAGGKQSVPTGAKLAWISSSRKSGAGGPALQ